MRLGLRPADPRVPLGPPVELSTGANPQTSLLALEVPETLVVERIEEVWHAVKKKAIIGLVFDKSGSMKGAKLGAAIKGAQAFVRSLDLGDTLLWIPFSDQVYAGRTRGLKSKIGEQLIGDVGAIAAGGNTALYDAILLTASELEALRKTYRDTVRYGIIVLSDGKDTGSPIASPWSRRSYSHKNEIRGACRFIPSASAQIVTNRS